LLIGREKRSIFFSVFRLRIGQQLVGELFLPPGFRMPPE
jgi:hypothetical protein